MTFEEWWATTEWSGPRWNVSFRNWAQIGWDAALADITEPNDPSPTEMVRRLLEKGWTIEQEEDDDGTVTIFRGPNGIYGTTVISEAYRKAFPPRRRVEIEVWKDKHGSIYGQKDFVTKPENEKRFTKGTAVFWVEESR